MFHFSWENLFFLKEWFLNNFIKLPSRIFIKSVFFFFIVEFQWFFIELSVRPGIILVISAHLFPWAVWAKNSIHSSWSSHSAFKMEGFKWLCQRYLHCFPSLPGTNLAIKDHLWGPYFSTNFLTRKSSSSVQGFFRSIPSLWLDSIAISEMFYSSMISLFGVFFRIDLNYDR